jgi:lipid A 3-O-deacylase
MTSLPAVDFSSKGCYLITLRTGLIVTLLLAAAAGGAEDFRLESAGVRFGIPADPQGQGFQQGEAFVDWNLPWEWSLGPHWHAQSRADLSAGWLGRDRADAAIMTLGPTLVVGYDRFPVTLEGGASLTGLSRDQFGSRTFSTLFQFTSHIGINWDFAAHLRAGYRFQHMSNAGIKEPNPGLNLHVLAVSYLF